MLLMIDNYDSFTYNLVQYFQELGQDLHVVQRDAISVAEALALAPEYLVISPGPGAPAEAATSKQLINAFAGCIPILGVCLGHQCIAEVFGGKVITASKILHGKTSLINHYGTGLFTGCTNPMRVTRYHSLIVDEASLPSCLEVTAWSSAATSSREVMAIAHQELQIYGVQFHPESILSEFGHQLLRNFLAQGVMT